MTPEFISESLNKKLTILQTYLHAHFLLCDAFY